MDANLLAALRRLAEDGDYPQDMGTRRALLESGAVDLIGGTELRPNWLAEQLLEED